MSFAFGSKFDPDGPIDVPGHEGFLELVALAGCELAKTEWQRRLVYWLVRRDPAVVGMGCHGFDISELGWTAAHFAEEKRFLIDVIEAPARPSPRLPHVGRRTPRAAARQDTPRSVHDEKFGSF